MDRPSSAEIVELKQRYDEVSELVAGGHCILYRSISFYEFDHIAKSLTDQSSSVDVEDDLVKLAVVWPTNFDPDNYKPGLITVLADKIKETSCLDGEVYQAKEVLERWRDRVSGIRGEMYAFILFALTQYKAEDLDKMTFFKLSELVALSEKVIALRQLAEGVEVRVPIRLEIYTPEEMAVLGAQKVSDHGNATVADPIAQKLMEAM